MRFKVKTKVPKGSEVERLRSIVNRDLAVAIEIMKARSRFRIMAEHAAKAAGGGGEAAELERQLHETDERFLAAFERFRDSRDNWARVLKWQFEQEYCRVAKLFEPLVVNGLVIASILGTRFPGLEAINIPHPADATKPLLSFKESAIATASPERESFLFVQAEAESISKRSK